MNFDGSYAQAKIEKKKFKLRTHAGHPVNFYFTETACDCLRNGTIPLTRILHAVFVFFFSISAWAANA